MHAERFPIPYWAPKGPHTFFALDRKGSLSLWLCCDYDLGVFEEQQAACCSPRDRLQELVRPSRDVDIQQGFTDDRLTKPTGEKGKEGVNVDKSKEPAPWPGATRNRSSTKVAVAFKLDGANQVMEHADRKWGNGMTDEEMHNFYPVIYAKQMSQGFEEHAKRRSMVYFSGQRLCRRATLQVSN